MTITDLSKVDIMYNEASREQWDLLMGEAKKGNRLQSWGYGEAKKNIEQWSVDRAIIKFDDRTVAFVQILQKKIFGILNLIRINRGPVFLEEQDTKIKIAVIKKLVGQLSNISRGRVLSIAAELNFCDESVSIQKECRIFRIKRGMKSAWINLSEQHQILRKRLSGNWRSKYISIEREDLKIEISEEPKVFEWLLKQSSEMMKERRADKIPTELYRAYRKELLLEKRSIFIVRENYRGEPVAGICIDPFGLSANYLFGWCGDQGRKLKANQLIFWQAILHLKNSGYLWFDLGGLNQKRTPGITQFKRSFNGEQYQLVDEGFCL